MHTARRPAAIPLVCILAQPSFLLRLSTGSTQKGGPRKYWGGQSVWDILSWLSALNKALSLQLWQTDDDIIPFVACGWINGYTESRCILAQAKSYALRASVSCSQRDVVLASHTQTSTSNQRYKCRNITPSNDQMSMVQSIYLKGDDVILL